MKSVFLKILSLFLLVSTLAGLGGCGVFELTEEDMAEIQEETAEVVLGQSIGQELVATYAADANFSLNAIFDSSFNPYQTSSAWNQVVGMLVYENLVELDESFEAQPNLITAWETEDGIHWRFSVDTTRTFHDGGAMTAHDAVYSINQAMAYGGKYARRLRQVIGISANDSETFDITLDEANYRFYQLLNIPCIEYNTGSSSTPPGTGPYRFSEAGTYLILEESHPQASEMPLGTIYLKEYSAAEDILQAFEDSWIDLVINEPNGMSSLGYSSTNIIKYVDTTSMHYLGYNLQSSLFSGVMARAIMTYAIDRDAIVSDVMEGAGVAATLPIHPDSPLYPADYAHTLAYSRDGFQNALNNIGAADVDGDGQLEFAGRKYTINFIVCADSATKVSAARRIASELQKYGFAVNLRELSYEDYLESLEEGNFDIYYAEVKLCADWDLSKFFESGGDLNYGGLNDNALLNAVKTFLASPPETLDQSRDLLCQYIGQNAPITVICFERSEVLYHRGVLAGLTPTQDNIFHGLENWTIDLG